jgi:outer membrane protein assembly factor BamA
MIFDAQLQQEFTKALELLSVLFKSVSLHIIVFMLMGVGSSSLLAQTLEWSDSTSTVKPYQYKPAPDQLVTVDKIFIIGNKRTKERIILRELETKESHTYIYKDLTENLKLDRRKVMNTQLFLDVKLSLIHLDHNKVDLIIRVAERWYTVPSPFFQLADRNFNVWLTNQNRDWNRVEYGMRFYQYNFRGLNERIYFFGQLGFTRQLSIRYQIPYIDKAQKNGLEFGFSFSENANTNYITEGHRLIFTDSLKHATRSQVGLISWRYRPSFFNNHRVDLRYNDISITDTIAALNPNFFLNSTNNQRYFTLTYSYVSDHRDFVGYPLKGYRWEGSISKLGLGIFDDLNLFRVRAEGARYFELGKGFYFAGVARGMLSTPGLQPYANLTGLGYNQIWIRGYELDAIEGNAFMMQQNTIRKRLFAEEFDLSRIVPIDQFNTLPLAMYIKAYFDHGYLWNDLPYLTEQPLANRYLFGYGVGLDIVSFYDFVFRIEHSWKHSGDSGIFFHFRSAF